MDLNFLEFEQPIAELVAKIDELRLVGDDAEINIQEEIERLEEKGKSLTEIAETLCISIKTVSTHRMRVLDKMKMTSNAELIRYTLEQNLLE